MTAATRQLVGREEELGSLIGLLDALPAVAVVSGEAGIGKTALWLAALEEARARGFRVLSCRPSEPEASYSFSGLADLLGGAVPDGLPAPQREALATALALSDADRPVEERLVAFAFLSAVRSVAGQGTVVLAVDDLQWLDEPSLALLRYALARLEGEPLAVLLTVRGDVPPWLARLEAFVELELRPLSVGAIHELLRARLDAAFPRPVLLRIWETSGGNPFFALELARALQRRGGRVEAGAELPVPATLDELVQQRLELLTPEAEEVCRAAAASSDPTVQLIERVVAGDANRGLDDAQRARVLELDGERIRFAHPLLGSAVAARTAGDRKRSLHERLAEFASDPEQRARHLALASFGPSERVAAALDAAARRASARGAASAAADLGEQALALTPADDAEARLRRTLDAADLHFHAGDLERAVVVLERAGADARDARSRAAVLLRLGRFRAESSGAVEAVALWRRALADARGDEELEARILCDLGEFLRFTEGAEAALAHLQAAVEIAERFGDDELSCRALAAYALVHFNSGRGTADDAIERALALEAVLGAGNPTTLATPFLAHQLVWTGDAPRARAVLARLRDWFGAREEPNISESAWYLALLEWRAGNWEAAANAAAESVRITEQFGREAATITGWPVAVVAAHRGEVERARALAERGLAAPGRPDVSEAGYEWVLGFIDLSRDDAHGALEHLAVADRILATLEIREPAMLWHVPDLLDALLAEGDAERVEQALAPWEERAHALGRAWALAIAARTRALLAATRGDVDEAFGRFDEALSEHARADDPFQRARTLLALGATQRRAKRRRAARETLEQAVAVFDGLPSPLWAEKARAELARIGGRSPSRGELTEAERRIAALVAEGHTNREVAATLFLTEHTVETALTRIYRKLDVHSRTALARRLSSKS